MKVAILDDETFFTDILEGYFTRFQTEYKVKINISIFHSGKDLLEGYKNQYDIVFLDIQMEEINGMEVARKIRAADPNVVILFITNMSQYALYGYEVNAVDYILKPLTYPDFVMKFKKALKFVVTDKGKVYTIRTIDGIVTVPIRLIYYIEVNQNYLYFHTKTGMQKARGTMKEVTAELEKYYFARINACYLVNMRHITSVKTASIIVNSDELLISRNRKKPFMEKYMSYVSKR